MKVVHIGFRYGTLNSGGAAIAASRLHLAMLERGVESHYVCVHKLEDGPNVHVLPVGALWRRLYLFLTRLSRVVWRFSLLRKPISINIIPLFGLERLIRRINPDVVHVHWINADVCTFGQLARLKGRLVLNLHDLYWLKGPFLLPHDIGQEGLLGRWLARRRNRLIQTKQPVFIGPSKWVCSEIRNSAVCNQCKVATISNIVGSVFGFYDRKKINAKFTMLFGAFGGRWNSFKGWSDCERSLRLLSQEVRAGSVVNVIGETAQDCEVDGLKVHFLGEILDVKMLVDVYNHTDILLFPSVQETQGIMKIEAMLCGVPVIAFDRAACAEGIVHKKNGWIAHDGNLDEFAKGIEWYYNTYRCGSIRRKAIASSAVAVYNADCIVKEIIATYTV